MDLLDRYIEELKQELAIDDFNVSTVQKKLPARRHFWAARLITHKRDVIKLEKEKKELEDSIAKKLKEKSLTRITMGEALAMARSTDEVIKLVDKINEYKLIIELLEKAEKNLSSMVWDIKNIVALMQLETL